MFGFGRRRRHSDPDLGVLEYRGKVWTGKAPHAGNLAVDLEGGPDAPHPSSLAQARTLLADLSEAETAARAFLKLQDLGEWSFSSDRDLVLEGFCSFAEPGRFELLFSLAHWPDALIVVLFRQGRPAELQLSD
jgi:hypothetical protein